MSTVREAFLSTFAHTCTGTAFDERPLSLRRQDSYNKAGFSFVKSSEEEDLAAEEAAAAANQLPQLQVPPTSRAASVKVVRTLEKLCEQLCSALSKNGRPLASLWQLQHLLSLYPEQPERVVSAARKIAQPHAGSPYKPMTAYQWLHRVGLEKHFSAFRCWFHGISLIQMTVNFLVHR